MNDTLNDLPNQGSTPAGISRRNIALGAAWAVPAVLAVGSAPAFAASGTPTISGSICELHYGSGTINTQVHTLYFGVTSSTGTVPAGTKLSWQICLSGGTGSYQSYVPDTNYSAEGKWALSLSSPTGTVLDTYGGRTACFTATLTFNEELQIGMTPWCAPALIWTDQASRWLNPGVTITATSQAPTNPTAGAIVSGGSGSLVYDVARRYHQTTTNTNLAHEYKSKSGTHTCYPAIRYHYSSRSSWSGCGDGRNDTSTIYPGGGCVRQMFTSGSVILPAVC